MTQETPEPRYEEAFVDVVGARVHYLHAGNGKPMLLIHGLVGSSANWRNNIGALAQHASVYAIDMVNMGKSQRVGGLDAGLTATANRIVAVMDALNLAEADIVAHSHGGAVALMLAALHPRRVRRLILFAPANPYSRSSDVMVRIYSTAWGGILAWMLPYLPAQIQRIALGGMYGGADRVPDRCLQEIVDGLRSPATLRHVLCIIRCWCAEMAKLKAALRRVKTYTNAAGLGGSRLHGQSELRHSAEPQTAQCPNSRSARGRPLRLRGETGGVEPNHAGMAWTPSVVQAAPVRPI